MFTPLNAMHNTKDSIQKRQFQIGLKILKKIKRDLPECPDNPTLIQRSVRQILNNNEEADELLSLFHEYDALVVQEKTMIEKDEHRGGQNRCRRCHECMVNRPHGELDCTLDSYIFFMR